MSRVCRFASVLTFSLISLSTTALATESTNTWYLRGPDGGYTDAVALDSSGQLLTGGQNGLFRYDALGSSWIYANAGMPTPLVSEIATLTGATFVNSAGDLARSTDSGVSWHDLSKDPSVGGQPVAGQLLSIATSPPSRVFVAGDPMGLVRSDDKGSTWVSVGPAMSANLVRVSPTNPNLVFVGNTAGQLLISTDGGATFPNSIQSNIVNVPQFFDVAQDPFNALHLIAVAATGLFSNRDTGGEVWVSNDAGTNWSVSTDNFVFAPETTVGAEPRSVLFDATTPNVVYFATTLGVFKSSSGGTSPAVSSAGLMPMGARPSGGMPYDEVDKLARSANGSVLYAATASGGVYQSTDQAANWTPLRTGYQGLVIRIFAFQPGSSVVLAGSSGQPGIGGIYRSTDGGTTWAPSSSGMNSLGIRGIAFAPANPNIVLAAGGAQQKIGGEFNKGVWRSTDGGVTWTSITSGLAQGYKRIVLFDPNNANHVMMSSNNGIIVSADAGLTWAYPTNGLPDQVAGSGAYVLGIAVGPGPTSGTTRFYAAFEDDNPPSPPPPPGAEGGVYYSDDGGNTWTASASPANGGLPDDSAAYFSVSPTAGTLYVSKINVGQVGRASGVFKSTDYGVHWQDSTNNLTCTYVAAYADQVDANVVWAPCGGGGLFRSNDGGASWAPYDIGLRNKSILWMSIDPANSNNILAGGYEGIDQMNYAPDADQDGIPDSVEKAAAGGTGDGNLDGIPDYTQANVASTPLGTTVTPAAKTSVRAATTATDYVVVELDQSAAHTGTCQLVSDLVVVPSDQIPISNRMVQAAPTISFILPNCQSATVNIRYSANTSYPVGVFGSYSPIAPGDAITQWGLFDTSKAHVDNATGVWTLQLDQNAYGNVYAPDTGSILFQGAPGKDSIFGNGFD